MGTGKLSWVYDIACHRHGAQAAKCIHYRFGFFVCVRCWDERLQLEAKIHSLEDEPGRMRLHVLLTGLADQGGFDASHKILK